MTSKTVTLQRDLIDRVVNALEEGGWLHLEDELVAAIAAPLSPDHSGGGAGMVLPKGWKLVPITPTSSMLEAGKDERMNCFTNPNLSVEGALIRIYSAIIDAAPICLDKVKELNQ